MKKIQFLLLSVFLCASPRALVVDPEIGITFAIKHGKEFRTCSRGEIKIPLDVPMVYAIAAEIDAVLACKDYPGFHGIYVNKGCTGLPCIPFEYTICLDIEYSSINFGRAKAAIAKAVEKKVGATVRW